MGTRHLVAVIHKDEYKVAQYGQWDGYPSGQGDTVLDCFMGVGTTAIAAKLLGRSFLGCDNDQNYVELSNKRLKDCDFRNASEVE